MKKVPEVLGQSLATLRRRARMSQRELSRVSDVSYTQIGDLERGQGGNPSPLTLRALARGLATDAFHELGYEPVRADAFYRQLMAAAGYLGGLPIDAPPKRIDDEDVIEFLAAKTGDSAVAQQLVDLAARYPELESEDQLVVRRLLGTWIKEA